MINVNIYKVNNVTLLLQLHLVILIILCVEKGNITLNHILTSWNIVILEMWQVLNEKIAYYRHARLFQTYNIIFLQVWIDWYGLDVLTIWSTVVNNYFIKSQLFLWDWTDRLYFRSSFFEKSTYIRTSHTDISFLIRFIFLC